LDDFSFLDLIWTIIVIYALFVVIMILFSIVGDLFRDRELSGWGKAGWLILLIVFPLVGILLYLIFRHQGMMERAAAQEKAAKAEFDTYVKDTAGTGGPAQEIASAKALLDSGAITEDEFAALKAKALS
jgi:NADH:ubiquinone oxidoreductase subunit 6 (subunit J)